MSRWLNERVQCVFLRPDAGPSRLLGTDCSRRGRSAPPPEPDPVRDAETGPKPELDRPRTWKDVADNSGDWRDTVNTIIEAIRPFPDALKAVLAALDRGGKLPDWRVPSPSESDPRPPVG